VIRRPGPPARPDDAPGTDARLALLRAPGTHGLPPGADVEAIETHMAWVVLAGDVALKLKKPVRHPFLDFSTTAARERACREELRLNRRLAPGVYLGLDTLRWDGRALTLAPESAPVGDARVVDWVVRMRRLPRERMLDAMIARGAVGPAEVDAIAGRLAAFYRAASPPPPDGARYVARFVDGQAANRAVLGRPGLAPPGAPGALDRLDRALAATAGRLRARAAQGRIVDGHGDLRAEHVCLLETPLVIDALEFDAELRRCDPFDEIALLGVECEVLGAAWIGPRLVRHLETALADPDGAALVPFYRASRALLRARLALAHLLEPSPRTPLRWAPLAARFVAVAHAALDAAGTA
jgi:aminoglycoside phosphotransferase family enzyme